MPGHQTSKEWRDMAIDQEQVTQTAAHYAQQSSAVAADLKPGTYEAAQALAFISIAHSLAILAENSRAG